MKLKPFALAAGLSAMVGYVTMPPMTVIAAAPQLAEKADDLMLKNVKIGKDGEVSGEVANTSKQTVRDVELQILYSWRWKDELHPGKDDPGRAVYVTVDREIAPGQSAPFNYKPSPPVTKEPTLSLFSTLPIGPLLLHQTFSLEPSGFKKSLLPKPQRPRTTATVVHQMYSL